MAGALERLIDKAGGDEFESYTVLTLNADGHPLTGRMHKPEDPGTKQVLPLERQAKRSVIAIEAADIVSGWRAPSSRRSSYSSLPSPRSSAPAQSRGVAGLGAVPSRAWAFSDCATYTPPASVSVRHWGRAFEQWALLTDAYAKQFLLVHRDVRSPRVEAMRLARELTRLSRVMGGCA